VLGQLGAVLHFEYPTPVRKTFLDPIQVFLLNVDSLLHPTCLGFPLQFYTAWAIQMFALPAAGLLLVLLRYAYLVRDRPDAAVF